MLDINMEFRKGILFVRLGGVFTKESSKMLDNELDKLINTNNVRFVTFNISELIYIDFVGIKTILKYNATLSKMNGKALICGINNELVKLQINSSKVPLCMHNTIDELDAINYINLGGYL